MTTFVLLDGGPHEFLGTSYRVDAGGLESRIKIAHGNGYEHYTHNGTFRVLDGEQLPVFVWCDRTRIAE
ncbi:DUF5988 family protein [Cryptosporangium arvum]|uniref:Uncharacterized protein n=1 Tax=Cryptosporangium arvum DSM 44712 TaxID=927661 RepID=A0A010ZY63_9ACTN|nr:DUF5988 family protein [Cryptosporangium arvum]EXG82152.1 hypothetical protein CryarDRAFT_3294 [Cryptosporangium arvum DSM 44712]